MSMAKDGPISKGCWWSISEAGLRQMLREVADGADPETVYIEHYANSEHEHAD